MFWDFLYEVISLNWEYVLNAILANLGWLFAFIAVGYFFTEGKKTISLAIIVISVLWAMNDGAMLIGWLFVSGSFLLLFYVAKFLILAFVEDTPQLANKLILLNEFSGYAVWILFNLAYLGIVS